MASYSDLVAALHLALTGSSQLGQYEDTVADRLMKALDAAWDLADAAGVSGQVKVIAGSEEGPSVKPDSLLADAKQQALSRFRYDASSRPRNLAEAAQQLDALLRALDGTTPPPPPTPPPASDGKILFAMDMTKGDTTAAGMDGWPQYQEGGGSIYKGGPLPIVGHAVLGRAVKATLPRNGQRREVMPPSSVRDVAEGVERFVRKDFVLDTGFPVGQSNSWCIVEQLHHGGSSGSPPVEFDVHNGALWVRGNSNKYNEKLIPVTTGTKYTLVYRVVASSSAAKSLLEVWVNGQQVLQGYRPPIPLQAGGTSYLKGVGLYADPSVAPSSGMTAYFANYRIGTSFGAVTR